LKHPLVPKGTLRGENVGESFGGKRKAGNDWKTVVKRTEKKRFKEGEKGVGQGEERRKQKQGEAGGGGKTCAKEEVPYGKKNLRKEISCKVGKKVKNRKSKKKDTFFGRGRLRVDLEKKEKRKKGEVGEISGTENPAKEKKLCKETKKKKEAWRGA